MKKYLCTPLSLAGLSAMAAGAGFLIVGFFHPVNEASAVTTDVWVNVHIVAIAMCFFGLFGLAGIYARQAKEIGWVGLCGFVLLSIWFILVAGFSFVEAFILPIVATSAPDFVEGFLGVFSGTTNGVSMGVLPTLWMLSGPAYILGQLLVGIATLRARIFPRNAALVLAASAVLTPAGALLPPQHEPLVMVPIGIAFCWLGYTLWSEQQKEVE